MLSKEIRAVIVHAFPESSYPFRLCGCGNGIKVLQSLDLAKMNTLAAAIGTVADIVSMTDENKCLVTKGKRAECPSAIGTIIIIKNEQSFGCDR